MATRAVNLDGEAVGLQLKVVPKVNVSLRFVSEHFSLSIGVKALNRLRKDDGPKDAGGVLQKKVKALPNVEDIPKGVKGKESEALVARALTEDLREWLDLMPDEEDS